MRRLRVFVSRLIGTFVRRRSERELSDEIEAHLEFLTEEHLRRGMSREDARAAARRDFGGVEQVKELYREQRGLPFVDALRPDFAFSLRLLLKDRWVSAVVVVAMAMGIGANTAMFSLVDGLLIRTLPVRDPERLIPRQLQRGIGANVLGDLSRVAGDSRARLVRGYVGVDAGVVCSPTETGSASSG